MPPSDLATRGNALTASFADEIAAALAASDAVAVRARSVAEARAREGRTLGRERREELAALGDRARRLGANVNASRFRA